MHLLHFVVAWLFPGAVCGAAVKMAKATTMIAEALEPDNASSLAFSVEAPDSASSISSSSSSPSSSSSDGHPRFFTSRQQSPPASPLCFGAGGAGRLLRGFRGRARARSSTKHDHAAAAAANKGGDVVGRNLRKISRRLRKARNPKGSPPSPSRCAACAADDTATERAEAVARALAYCKDTLRRGAAPARPPPSPSLDDWLHDRQEEIIASAAAHCHERTDSQTQPPRPPSPSRGSSATATAVGNGEESPHHRRDAIGKCSVESSVTAADTAMSSSPSDLAADELKMTCSFDEMQFLKIFDRDEEMIGRHFITVRI